jgi:CDP-diacylglycerol--serine O-phosphatidyltransferase
MALKNIAILPNLVTLANAFCGLLALSKAIDAIPYIGVDSWVFYEKMESACLLVFLGMVFDAADGWVARLTKSSSEFGAMLDSFADLLTFGVVPAMLAKVMIEHEGSVVGYEGNARMHFLAAATFSIFALLRLCRFTLETEPETDDHKSFSGLPSPAAAGAVTSWIWMYLILQAPQLETAESTKTPVGMVMTWIQQFDWSPFLTWAPLLLALYLPILGLLMISRIRYSHGANIFTQRSSPFSALVVVVGICFLLFLAPVPVLFVVFNGFVILGALKGLTKHKGQVAK